MRIAVYGATGHTGGFITAELGRRGAGQVLVGRDAAGLRETAGGLDDVEVRTAGLSDPDALRAAFAGADAVISALPAYVDHGEPVLAAAIAAGAHYVDLSGEQRFLERVFEEYADRAEAAGVTVLPGVTDNNVPADLLGHLIARLVPDGSSADLVISHLTYGGGQGSRGSARTALANRDWLASGGYHYEDGEFRTGGEIRYPMLTVPGSGAEIRVAKFPQPAVLTIPRHTPVRYIAGALDAEVVGNISAVTPELVEGLPEAPPAGVDMRYDLVVDAHTPDGGQARGVVSGVDSYRDSALLAVEIAARLAGGAGQPGALAPAEAFDPAEFLDALAPYGITWRIEG